MTANTDPTATTSPSLNKISFKIPEHGAGTSESTLSVAISTIGSSSLIESPTAFNHVVMVASATLSPILGSSTLNSAIRHKSFKEYNVKITLFSIFFISNAILNKIYDA